MTQLLKIVGLGLVIWALSLVWPLVNVLLSSRLADAIIVGLVVAAAAYFLGRNFTRPLGEPEHGREVSPVSDPHPTRPSAPIVYPFNRSPRPTRPIPALLASDLHARATRPVPVKLARHSRITEPVSAVR